MRTRSVPRIVTFALLLSLAGLGRAVGAVGGFLGEEIVPVAAQCGVNTSSSLAVVPGSVVGQPAHPVLLVTSCNQTNGDKLYYLAPTTSPATLVLTVTTDIGPPNGWGALTFRSGPNTLLGCSNENGTRPKGYSINPTTGVTTYLFDGGLTTGGGTCSGLGWDATDGTTYQSHILVSGVNQIDSGNNLYNLLDSPAISTEGVAVSGLSLFINARNSSAFQSEIFWQAKVDQGLVRSFLVAGEIGDIDCDPLTFAGKDALWGRGHLDVSPCLDCLIAHEVRRGTCGLGGALPAGPPPCPDGTTPDADGDGLLDCWETSGIDYDGDGTVDLTLYDTDQDGKLATAEKADTNNKDLFVEIDWMKNHKPLAHTTAHVTDSFKKSPVNNPSGKKGIRLHVQEDEEAAAHSDDFAFVPCTPVAGVGDGDFDTVKRSKFGTAKERANANRVKLLQAKRLVFHYGLWVHDLKEATPPPPRGFPSGCAELPGNDFVVALGNYGAKRAHEVGTQDQHDGTFMHEFGHNLNLKHGGGDHIHRKPNYLSVMSYSRQWTKAPLTTRKLDYSPTALASLDETNLDENVGIGGPGGDENRTTWGPAVMGTFGSALSNGKINWNRNGVDTDMNVVRDLNNFGTASPGQTLDGYDDWSNILYNFRGTRDFGDGASHQDPQSELTATEALAQSTDDDLDTILDLVDNCPDVSNSTQTDSNSDGIGDACQTEVLLAGTKLQIKDNADPTKRKVSLQSTGTAITVPSPGSSEDFTLYGATITLINPSRGVVEEWPLPAVTDAKGKPLWTFSSTSGYKYKDSKLDFGPVKSASISAGKLKAGAKGIRIAYDLDATAQVSISVTLAGALGAVNRCMVFGPPGTVSKDTPDQFFAKAAPPPSACTPLPPAPP